MEEGPRVIILNGVGSVGKSLTARAIQEIAAKPFLRISMDALSESGWRSVSHLDGQASRVSIGR